MSRLGHWLRNVLGRGESSAASDPACVGKTDFGSPRSVLQIRASDVGPGDRNHPKTRLKEGCTETQSQELWAEHQRHLLRSFREGSKHTAVCTDLQCGPEVRTRIVLAVPGEQREPNSGGRLCRGSWKQETEQMTYLSPFCTFFLTFSPSVTFTD